MAISSCSAASSIGSLQAAANSADPLQQQIGNKLLKQSLQQEGESALALVQAATAPTPAEPGSLGASVNVKA